MLFEIMFLKKSYSRVGILEKINNFYYLKKVEIIFPELPHIYLEHNYSQ